MIRVLVVDDHEIVRRGLIELLNGYDGLEVVAQVGSLEEGLAFSDFSSIDVALLDVRLADGSGIELCRHFHQEAPGLHCIMLTSYADDDALLASVLAGARGFVLKDINSDALVSAIRSVAAGNELMSSDQIESARRRLQRETAEDARLASLSPRERQILDLLSEGFSNREMSETLFLSEKTVKNYVSFLLSKLGFQRRTEAALFAKKMHDRDPGRSF